MHIRSVLLVAGTISSTVFAQGPGLLSERITALHATRTPFTQVALFTREPASGSTDALWTDACRTAEVLHYDEAAARTLIGSGSPFIALDIPSVHGTLRLDLVLTPVTASDFTVRRASDGRTEGAPNAAHYRGIVHGEPGSLVAISVFEGELMGMISDAGGERVIGRFARAPHGLHVFYHERDLLRTSNAQCGTPDLPGNVVHAHPEESAGDRSMRCVHWYWEAANDIYLDKGSSVANVTTYLTGLFNQSAVIYANDGVNVLLQEVFVWDVASPYNGTSSGSRLSQFGTTRTSFNGEMAHLLDYGGYGGVAWVNTLCSGTSSRMAYSGIYGSFSNVPVYSWSVEVVTHEQGHNLGSSHTHACVWNGNSTAIDGCGPTAGYTEGSCPNAGLPAGGGTIMSYCHLIGGTGINFANGFGPQPAQVIRDRVNAAACLLTCGTTCDAPGLMSVSSLTTTSCTLNWSNVGAVSYTLRWKAIASGSWNIVTGLTAVTYPLTGLAQSTPYEFQVLSVCSAGSSAYSTSFNFATPAPCPEAFEPNNTYTTPADIALPTTVNALIATNGDQDFYRFTVTGASTVNLYLGTLPGDYDLYLLSNAGTQLVASENGGTSSESINYSATAGTYVIKVVGYNGAFSGTQCYQLSASAYVAQCGPVTGLNAASITYNSATLGWNAVLTTGTYDLQWKPTSGSTWTTVSALSTNSYPLTGLTGNTSYDFHLKPNCAGSQSGYGEPVSFTTTTPPCDVQPPMVLALKVLLEGPYKQAEGLMTDSLRKQGWLPLTEPYTALGLAVTGASTTTSGVMAVTGNNAIVDWLAVELRDATTNTTIVERKAALLQRDGDVVGTDGTSPLGFCGTAGSYRVVVRHRNHQGCMSAQNVTLNGTTTALDLTSAAVATYGTNARKTVGIVQVLWAGNTNGDVSVKYTGTSNDRDPVLTAVGSTTPNNAVSGYLRTDVNMDGFAKYTGTSNDRDPILLNVGSTTPNNVRVEQLP